MLLSIVVSSLIVIVYVAVPPSLIYALFGSLIVIVGAFVSAVILFPVNSFISAVPLFTPSVIFPPV